MPNYETGHHKNVSNTIVKETCLDQRSLGQFLVDLWLVHDILGPVSIVQCAQSFLEWKNENQNALQ